MFRTLILFISILCLCSQASLASDATGNEGQISAASKQKEISVYTLDIEGLIGKSSDNKYNKLFEKISKISNFHIKLISEPGKRLERAYTRAGDGCIFPDYQAPNTMKGLYSVPFNYVNIYLVVLKENTLSEPELISGKTIGTVNGYGYDFIDLSSAKSVMSFENERQNLNMLIRGRVEAIISYFPDLPLVMTEQEESIIHFDKDNPLFISPERLGCYDNANNKAFLEEFSRSIATLNKTEELEKILAPYFYGLNE